MPRLAAWASSLARQFPFERSQAGLRTTGRQLATDHRDTRVATALEDAIKESLTLLREKLDGVAASVGSDARARDDLERAVFDIEDLGIQNELRTLLTQVDDHADSTRRELEHLDLYQCLDPIRAIASDLASGFF